MNKDSDFVLVFRRLKKRIFTLTGNRFVKGFEKVSSLQNRLNKSCRRCVLAPGTQLAPGAERGEVNQSLYF